MSIIVEGTLAKIFDQLDEAKMTNTSNLLAEFLSRTYGLLITFMSDELTPQQRQIWLVLVQQYPKPSSGVELAKKTGFSTSSKAIYKSINKLKDKNIIEINQLHPRTFSIQANANHPLTSLLIEFCQQYSLNI